MNIPIFNMWQGVSNVTSVGGLLVSVQTSLPVFIPVTFLCLFLIVSLSTYFGQERMTGRGDFLGSFAVGGIFIAIVSVIASNIIYNGVGLVPSYVTIISILVGIIGITIIFMQDNE